MTTTSSQELLMREEDFIVSKTDSKGKITYCNQIFMEFAGYEESELLGQPHNIIRHPDMPRAVYRLMWNTLQQGKEFHGIVKNKSKNGQFYWTYANATPSYDSSNSLLGYYSVRRCPNRESVKTISAVYDEMIKEEAKHSNSTQAMEASTKILMNALQSSGKEYNEYIISLES